MSAQLPLPAGWARQFTSRLDPREELAAIERAKLDAKAEIRAILERHAQRFRISTREIDEAIKDYADNMLSDFFHETKSTLDREAEERDPA